MSGLVRGVVLVAVLAVSACSQATAGQGTPPAAPTTTAAPSPASRPPDPGAVAQAVNLRAADLPAGWHQLPSRGTEADALSWLLVCARVAGAAPDPLSGGQILRFASGQGAQLGTATGVFPDDAAAAQYVSALRSGTVGQCVSTEAMRSDASSYRTVPPFVPVRVNVPTVADGAGLQAVVTLTDGHAVTYQFLAMRNGPVVTMLDAGWPGQAPDSNLLIALAMQIGTRQRAAQ